MNREEIYAMLLQRHIWHEITKHKAVFHMGELADVELPYPESDGKNLFVRDDKRRSYYLITVKGDKRVNLKELRLSCGTRPLSFASAEELKSLLGLAPGSVTPLGLLNNEARLVHFFLDEAFLSEPSIIGVHPNDNTATLWLKAGDLISLIEEHGTPVSIVSF